MIQRVKFSKPQQMIIQDICLIQIASLTRVYEEETEDDITLILAQHEVDPIEYKLQVASTIESFKDLYNNPDKLATLDNRDISNFRHILFHQEDEYQDKYPNALSNLWKKLFLIESFDSIAEIGSGLN